VMVPGCEDRANGDLGVGSEIVLETGPGALSCGDARARTEVKNGRFESGCTGVSVGHQATTRGGLAGSGAWGSRAE